MAAGVTSSGVTTAAVTIAGCQGCGACLLTCPQHAIRPSGRELSVSADRCDGCGECVEICPVAAIAFAPMAPSAR